MAGAGPVPRLFSPGLALLLGLAVLQGAMFGAANAGVNDLARADVGIAGLVWATLGLTSAVAGFVVTARPGPWQLPVRLRAALSVQATLVLGLLLVDGPLPAAIALAVLGSAVAPTLIALFGLAERVAPRERMGEAMTLLGSGLIIGQGLAAVVSGQLARAHGYTASFGLACTAAALALLLALLFARPNRLARPAALPGPPGSPASEPDASAPGMGQARRSSASAAAGPQRP